MKPTRFFVVDYLRATAVILMIFFHLVYDLNYFQIIKVDILHHPFWWFLPRLIVFLFLLCVGISLRIVHFPLISWPRFRQRLGKLIFAAGLISLSTFWLFPERWIYFGTLHCIALCSLIGICFLFVPLLAGALGIGLLAVDIVCQQTLPFWRLNHAAMDYISPFPWVGAVLLGIFLHDRSFHTIPLPPPPRLLSFLGQHAFVIYLAHQPLIFSLVWAGAWLSKKAW